MVRNKKLWASLVARTVKNLPATQETQVQSLGWEDALDMVQSLQFCIIMCINLRVYLYVKCVHTHLLSLSTHICAGGIFSYPIIYSIVGV